MAAKTRIAVLDDHTIFRQGLVELLNKKRKTKVIHSGDNAADYLKQIKVNASDPEMILADYEMPGMTGLEFTEEVTLDFPHIKVIILSMHLSPLLLSQCMKAGAVSFVDKTSGIQEVYTAMDKALNNELYFPKNVNAITSDAFSGEVTLEKKSKKVMLDGKLYSLIEIDVMRGLCEEKNSKEIAQKLNKSIRTVEGARADLLSKTGSRNVIGILKFAMRHNIVRLV